MRIITSGLKKHHRLDYVGIVRDLLHHLPPEHLLGISHITVSGDRPLDDDDDVLGQYFERYEQDPAGIVLYLETMKREAPAWLRLFPVTWRVLIAQTLYHEIAHHYQRFSHGIAKQRQEDHAEMYGDRYTRQAVPGWFRFMAVTRPIRHAWRHLVIVWLRLKVGLFPLASTHYDLGRLYWEDEDWDRAIERFEAALRIHPRARGVEQALREARWRRSREHRRHQTKAQATFENQHRLKYKSARRSGGRRQKKDRHGKT